MWVCSWLIAIAYFLAGGFIKSGLGNRIAYGIVSVFGKTTLGLTYSLVFAEALLSPAIPSVAARAGERCYTSTLSLSSTSPPQSVGQCRQPSFTTCAHAIPIP